MGRFKETKGGIVWERFGDTIRLGDKVGEAKVRCSWVQGDPLISRLCETQISIDQVKTKFGKTMFSWRVHYGVMDGPSRHGPKTQLLHRFDRQSIRSELCSQGWLTIGPIVFVLTNSLSDPSRQPVGLDRLCHYGLSFNILWWPNVFFDIPHSDGQSTMKSQIVRQVPIEPMLKWCLRCS